MKTMSQYIKHTLGLSVLACLFTTSQVSANSAPAKPVKVDQVTEVILPATSDFMGTVESRTHIPITAGVNGRIEKIAQPGDFVQQGDVLIQMDTLPLKLRLAEQKAQIKRAEINMRYLKNEVERLEQLKKTNATSQFQLDQQRSQYELAISDHEIAELQLKQVEDQLARAVVKAPFEGVVTERLMRAGSDVNRSDTLLRFLDTTNLEAHVYVPVKYLGFLRRGNELTLSADEQTIQAKIHAIIPSADSRSQTVEVRILIPETLNHVWAAGQLVKVRIPVQESKPSLTVHRDALILRKNGVYVVKVGNDSTVKRLEVNVGAGTDERVSIEGNIQAGDSIAIRGAERLQDGESVVVQ